MLKLDKSLARLRFPWMRKELSLPQRTRNSLGLTSNSVSRNEDWPTILHVLSPKTFLLATDSSALHLYDLRDNAFGSQKPAQTHHPHDDYISSLTPVPPTTESTSGFSKQWISTGGTTLAITDIRRGVLVRSEDQEEELLSSVYVGGLPKRGTSQGAKVLVGGAGGVVTLWERGQWDDQDERIVIDRGEGGGESLDALALLPENVGPHAKVVAIGMGNGSIRFVRVGLNRVIDELSHDDAEGVTALGFDVGGRMISAGGTKIKVWYEASREDDGVDEEDAEEEYRLAKRARDSDGNSDDADSNDTDDSVEDRPDRHRRKKKKKKGGKRNGKPNGTKANMDFKGLD
jgi:WD repeat-containing protein 55